MVLYGRWGWQCNISYFSVSSGSVPIQLKDISVLGFCFRLYLFLSVAAQMFLSFQGARLGGICCLTSVKNSDCRRDKSGATVFWHNGWYLLLSCTFSALWKSAQILPVFKLLGEKIAVCSCWVETSILSMQFPRISFSLVLLKPLWRLGGHCPLSMTHSLRDTQPRQICLSWVFWVRLLLSAGAEMTQRPEEGEREEWGSWEGWGSMLEEKRILAAQMDWGWARGKIEPGFVVESTVEEGCD